MLDTVLKMLTNGSKSTIETDGLLRAYYKLRLTRNLYRDMYERVTTNMPGLRMSHDLVKEMDKVLTQAETFLKDNDIPNQYKYYCGYMESILKVDIDREGNHTLTIK
jgi:hypothetical protein